MNPLGLPETLLSRIEDAGIHASAPPQQRWIDGWLVRTSPGKAKRARCVQAVADGRLPLMERLALCASVFKAAQLPMVFRLTPFSRPVGLDKMLVGQGYQRQDDTWVMAAPVLPLAPPPLPPGLVLERLGPVQFAEAIGALRGSPTGQRVAHAERLALSPVPCQAWALRQQEDGAILACGQTVAEAELVGLYDVFTHPQARGQGLARQLCTALLARAGVDDGARVAYLQVEADNHAARAIYHRLGFSDVYAYHYRMPDSDLT